MKRLLSVLLALSLVLSLTACGGKGSGGAPSGTATAPSQTAPEGNAGSDSNDSQPEPVDPPETAPAVTRLQVMKGKGGCGEWDENYNTLCYASWEDMKLIDDHPELEASLNDLNTEQSVGAYSFVQEWLPYAEEVMQEDPDYFGGFTLSSKYTVQRADSLLLSIREDFGSYTGGVHANYGVMGWNFDTATGAQLGLEDVLTDTDGLADILAKKIREKYTFEPFESLDLMLRDYAPENYTWTLGYQGITFYFSPYEIASFAAGLLTATIWFDEMPELFREEYTVTPEGGYAAALPYWNEIEVDLNADDDLRDTLSFVTQEGEFGEKHLILTLNGQEYTDDSWWAYTITPYLVCVGGPDSESFYLCVEGIAENDFRSMCVYDLNAGAPQRIADQYNLGFPCHWETNVGGEELAYDVLLNDPAQFTLSSRFDLLGTKNAYRSYKIASDGAIEPLSDTYDYDEEWPSITSTIPLELTLLPQNTVETIPEGTEFFFLRTDGESVVDLITADGQEYRVTIEHIDWTPTINGLPEWDCFEGLIYAG